MTTCTGDGRYGSAFRGDLDAGGPEQELFGESFYARGERGGKQDILSLGGNDFLNLADLRHEAHVHHAVRFVKDDVFELFRFDVAAGIDLQKPPRCRDD